MAPQITCVSIVCSTVGSGADQRIHQSSASLAFVRGIPRGPMNSPHKRPVMRKRFPFDDVVMQWISKQITCTNSLHIFIFTTGNFYTGNQIAHIFRDNIDNQLNPDKTMGCTNLSMLGLQCSKLSLMWGLGNDIPQKIMKAVTYPRPIPNWLFMMTSSNGNIFRVTGPLCGEFTGHRWIALKKASDAELLCFLWSVPE